MKANEKRRAVQNAVEILEREGAVIERCNTFLPTPVITISCAPARLERHAVKMTEKNQEGDIQTFIGRQSGCIVRWFARELIYRDQLENSFVSKPSQKDNRYAL